MTRKNSVGAVIKSSILGAIFIAGLTLPAQAGNNKLALSATTAFTTDYIFRGISNTNQGPAVQPELDLTYGMFYAGMWGSNTASGDGVEIDYYGGITPTWGPVTFDIGVLEYTYPGATSEADYFELKTGASYSPGAWTLGVRNYWAPDFSNVFGNGDAIEGSLAYAFSGKLFNFFSPSVSGDVGFQSLEKIASDYTYWDAGLTLGFMDRWSADVRYYDTDYSGAQCVAYSDEAHNCDARVVGTIKATF
jgi:uncharacterized protein (TIGR02001 family)